ncbi:hypothetical protein BX070DRAFT_254283 [Coemansia spiralis]|nr:hypothetical protein BX070DRAFT_254283 [Coemansia spiralis]
MSTGWILISYAGITSHSLQITDDWQLATKEVLKRDKRQQRQTKDKQWCGPHKLKTAMQMQAIGRIEFLYLQWKERNKMQTSREDTTAVRARRRREIMRQPRMSRQSRDNRTAAVPPIAGSRRPSPCFNDAVLTTVSQQHRVMAMRCPGVHLPRGA